MGGVLGGFLPIWVLTGIGFASARGGVLGRGAEQALGRFAFHLAMPAVLFTTLIDTDPSRLANAGVLAFVASTAVVCVAGYLLHWKLFRTPHDQRVLGGMASGYVNAGNLGIPIAIGVLGDSSFIAAVLLFQPLVMMPIVLGALEAGAGGRVLRTLALLPVRNPVIGASVLAVAVAATGWDPPQMLLSPIAALGAAGVPTALVGLGMSLAGRRHADDLATGDPVERPAEPRAALWTAVALKLLAHPLLALAFCVLLDVEGDLRRAAIVCAALPTAQNVHVVATRYLPGTSTTRNTVLVTTALSMLTLTAAALL
ncbi:AEC family transporter [Actinosynnema pretiosum subsp. pretiosum]|uniref:AEC family transporter n=1 Tax=Actinosynnema pretiosum subsp. pretiosum TaxID=103721 RepID=A0AA45R5Y7_9PSEU|nr:putative transport integral membrane protein [Actinosynnema pretiosum subsp. pretiosum]QUF06153.1 AEC family transporter [Actinosynnema pretiosum subsp. pretiosum]